MIQSKHIDSGIGWNSWYGIVKRWTLFSVAVLLLSMFLWADDSPQPGFSCPVLVELFTSEGCSSCPPADELLQQFDRLQPFTGAQLIVFSEHVDYWNHIGWTDPYSSRFFSDRQSNYSRRFDLNSVYTPQMVVDGAREFSGNDSELARKAVQKALEVQKITMHISRISVDSSHRFRAHVEAEALPEAGKQHEADVYLVIALNHAESQVLRGENGGRHLTHVAVVQSLTKIGKVEIRKKFAQEVNVNLDPKTDPADLRVIIFAQVPGQRQVLGAAVERTQ